MTPVGIEPRTSRFGVRRSTTAPLCSLERMQCVFQEEVLGLGSSDSDDDEIQQLAS